MKILTWNIDNDLINISERVLGIVDLLRSQDPDIICLQEVTKVVYDILINKLVDYIFTEYNNERSYTTIMAIKRGIDSQTSTSNIQLTSTMNREAIVYGTENLCIVTFHLESGPVNKQVRRLQINQILQSLNDDKVILCGDTNFIYPDENQLLIQNNFTDYSPNEPSYNYLENRRILGPYISYLDRVFAKNVSVKTTLIKNQLSDHYCIIMLIDL
jgi:endonuclease/exonuclease/phosphatase family metal-dependent hydrolase